MHAVVLDDCLHVRCLWAAPARSGSFVAGRVGFGVLVGGLITLLGVFIIIKYGEED